MKWDKYLYSGEWGGSASIFSTTSEDGIRLSIKNLGPQSDGAGGWHWEYWEMYGYQRTNEGQALIQFTLSPKKRLTEDQAKLAASGVLLECIRKMKASLSAPA